MLRTKAPAGGETSDPQHDAPAPARRLLFISHANPQDNAAAAWFATQLTLLGYDVWCDLKDTAGGESNIWLKVQGKIENEAAKFIFILSNVSRDFERKAGVYKEIQAADNLRRDNFILPVRIEKLNGSIPIIIGPDISIDAENWAHGLRELVKRLAKDGVPKLQQPDITRIMSWWPAVSANDALVRKEPAELVTNILSFKALPSFIHFLKVSSDANLISGRDQLKGALPAFPPYSATGAHAISFANAHDYLELTSGFEIADDIVMPTETFLASGCKDLGILPQTAQNITTYLVAAAFEKFLATRKLCSKTLSYTRRKIWYPPRGLIGRNNTYSFAEPGQRKAPVWFVSEIKHFTKPYVWHFGVQPSVDLRIHQGIVLSPKAIIAKPYRPERGEAPIPLDEKRVLKKLGWWNNDWRRKVLAFAAWLAEDTDEIRIPTGYQRIVLQAMPEVYTTDTSYLDKDDDEVVNEILDLSHAGIDPA